MESIFLVKTNGRGDADDPAQKFIEKYAKGPIRIFYGNGEAIVQITHDVEVSIEDGEKINDVAAFSKPTINNFGFRSSDFAKGLK